MLPVVYRTRHWTPGQSSRWVGVRLEQAVGASPSASIDRTCWRWRSISMSTSICFGTITFAGRRSITAHSGRRRRRASRDCRDRGNRCWWPRVSSPPSTDSTWRPFWSRRGSVRSSAASPAGSSASRPVARCSRPPGRCCRFRENAVRRGDEVFERVPVLAIILAPGAGGRNPSCLPRLYLTVNFLSAVVWAVGIGLGSLLRRAARARCGQRPGMGARSCARDARDRGGRRRRSAAAPGRRRRRRDADGAATGSGPPTTPRGTAPPAARH